MVWPAVVGGAFGLAGSLLQQSSARSQASAAQQFSERAYRNRYQWQMEDMRRAGLNPILAYKQGAPAGPSGVMAPAYNPAEGAMAGANSAANVRIAQQNYRNMKVQNRILQHDAILRDKQHNLTEQQANTAHEIFRQQEMETEIQRQFYEWINSPGGRRAREIYFWGKALNPGLSGASSAVDVFRQMTPGRRR